MRSIVLILALIGVSTVTRAADDFAARVDISPLETISLQHRQIIKTFDSYARQMISDITGRSSLDGHPAVFTILDIAARPEAYADRNIIKIKNVPIRQDLQRLDFISAEEKDRIVKQGTVSLNFMFRPEVEQLLGELESQAVFKANAVGQLRGAANTLAMLTRGFAGFPPAAIIAPPSADDHKWKRLDEIAGNIPIYADALKRGGSPAPAKIAGYDDDKLG